MFSPAEFFMIKKNTEVLTRMLSNLQVIYKYLEYWKKIKINYAQLTATVGPYDRR